MEDTKIFDDITDGIIKILPTAVVQAKEDIRKGTGSGGS